MRNWINLFESFQQTHEIDLIRDGGSVEGYVVASAAEQLENWLTNRHGIYLPSFVTEIRERYQTIAFLNNINVDENARGNGIGNRLMGDFIDDASIYGAQAIILLADLGEHQASGFDLVKWYEGWGFNVVPSSSSDPLMIMEMN